MYILDTERNEMLQRLLDPKFNKLMARPRGSTKAYLDEADAHNHIVAALAAVRTRLSAASAPRASLAAFACIAEVPNEGSKERVLDEDMFNLMHGMDVVDIGAPALLQASAGSLLRGRAPVHRGRCPHHNCTGAQGPERERPQCCGVAHCKSL